MCPNLSLFLASLTTVAIDTHFQILWTNIREAKACADVYEDMERERDSAYVFSSFLVAVKEILNHMSPYASIKWYFPFI